VTPSSSSITTAEALTVMIAVSGGAGNPTPTGSVTLTSGSYASAATTLASGSATITVPAGSLAVGNDMLTASYTPDTNSSSTYNTATGTSSGVTVTQAKSTPTVAVTPSSSSITTAQALPVTIAVTGGTGNQTPTGSVTLTSGGYASAASTLASGSATISIPAGSLAVGNDTVTASYTPDSNSSSTYNAATGTSPAVTVTAVGAAAAAPTFSPAAGAYTAVQMVKLSSTTIGARIYYTLDGSTPTTNSQAYSVPIYIGGAITVKAIAVATGYQNSPIATAAYHVTLPSAAAPTFSPAPGKYVASVVVSLGDTTPDNIIHYTLDGSTPLSSSPVYTGPLTLTKTTTVKAIATAAGYWKSAVAGAQYSVVPAAPTPVLTPGSGSYAPGQTVTISDAIPTATLRYTTDGSTPTTKSTFYTKPILLKGTETINAIAIATGDVESSVATATYTPQ